jgi:hypothetical protein
MLAPIDGINCVQQEVAERMSEYSPQAEALLNQWICLSQNMRSAIARAKYLQRKAESSGEVTYLENQLRSKRINSLYREIGREMRSMMSADGIQKSFPEDEPDMMMRRFVDFRISEDAIPELRLRMDRMNDLVLNLLITLCTIRIPAD